MSSTAQYNLGGYAPSVPGNTYKASLLQVKTSF